MSCAVIEPKSLPSSPALPVSVDRQRAQRRGDALGLAAFVGAQLGVRALAFGLDPLLVAVGGLVGQALREQDSCVHSPA